jgi:hypothetical protein
MARDEDRHDSGRRALACDRRNWPAIHGPAWPGIRYDGSVPVHAIAAQWRSHVT